MRPQVNDPRARASVFRRRRFVIIEEILRDLLAERARVRVLDIGGRRDYWNLLSPGLVPRLSVTILNNKTPELQTGAREDDPLETVAVIGDACAMPQYGDRSFDLVHSNSVIEHVGPLARMAEMAAEIRRVGHAYYVQTPHLWFPIEPHYGVPFFHWLPKATRAAIGAKRKVGYRTRPRGWGMAMTFADHTELLNAPVMRALFPDAELKRERVALMTKSLIAVRGAA